LPVTNARVFAIAGPAMLANLTTPLLGIVGTAAIGRLGEAYLLGGIAMSALVFDSIYWLFGFLRMGTVALTAQALGAGDATEQRAVLIRALEPLQGLALARSRRAAAKRDIDLMNGPGKLCEALGIDAQHNALSLERSPVRILRGSPVAATAVTVTPRIGISESRDWPLRFFVTDSPFVSRTPRGFPRFKAER